MHLYAQIIDYLYAFIMQKYHVRVVRIRSGGVWFEFCFKGSYIIQKGCEFPIDK